MSLDRGRRGWRRRRCRRRIIIVRSDGNRGRYGARLVADTAARTTVWDAVIVAVREGADRLMIKVVRRGWLSGPASAVPARRAAAPIMVAGLAAALAGAAPGTVIGECSITETPSGRTRARAAAERATWTAAKRSTRAATERSTRTATK